MAQGLIVLASPLLTRLYTPEEFGALAIYTALLSTTVVGASLRYELAIPLAERDEEAASLVVLALGIVAGTTVAVGLAVWLAGDRIVGWTNTPALGPFLWLLPVSFFGAGAYRVLDYWCVRHAAFGLAARTRVSQSLAQVLVQSGLGALNLGAFGLLAGDAAGRLGGSGSLVAAAAARSRGLARQLSPRDVARAAIRYRRFPLISGGSALINSAGLQLPALLFAAFYGPQVAGWIALGQRVIGLPTRIVGQAVAQAYLGEAAQLRRRDPGAVRRLFVRTAGRLLFVGAVPATALGLGGPSLFGWAFGEAWGEAGQYVRVLAVMFLVQFVVVPVSQTLNVMERQDLQLGWDVARLLTIAAAIALAGIEGLSPYWAVALYGTSMSVMYVALLLLSLAAMAPRGRCLL